MISSDYCELLADYNRGMNERLYALCGTLGDHDRKRDRGAFFGSIHSTLNHILGADLAFMSRFTGDPADLPPLGVDRHEDYRELTVERVALDRRICEWAPTITDDWLALPLTYVSKVDGQPRTAPRWALVTHMFNHQTHHRGQITTLLSQSGFDPGITDIAFMPRFGMAEVPRRRPA